MTLFSPLIIKSIFLTAGASTLAYCLAKITKFNCILKTISSNISHGEERLDRNQVLIKNTNDDLDTIKRLAKENSCRIETLNEDLTALKKELQDLKPVENKKKNS